MKKVIKFIIKLFLNFAALFIAERYFSGFILNGGWNALLIGALVLALLYALVRPVLKLIFTPLIWITLGLFNVVISIFLLWLADALLPQLAVTNSWTLFWTSLLIAIANII